MVPLFCSRITHVLLCIFEFRISKEIQIVAAKDEKFGDKIEGFVKKNIKK